MSDWESNPSFSHLFFDLLSNMFADLFFAAWPGLTLANPDRSAYFLSLFELHKNLAAIFVFLNQKKLFLGRAQGWSVPVGLRLRPGLGWDGPGRGTSLPVIHFSN